MTKHKRRITHNYNPLQTMQKVTNFTVDMAELSVVSATAIGTASIITGLIKK